MEDRFNFRIPMFTDKGNFCEFQYIELGEQIECALCGHNGEPEQCTGIKDKNGDLIFQGDIIKNGCGAICQCEWESLFCEFWFISQEGCNLQASNLYDYEIIGNIYQNSELLN